MRISLITGLMARLCWGGNKKLIAAVGRRSSNAMTHLLGHNLGLFTQKHRGRDGSGIAVTEKVESFQH